MTHDESIAKLVRLFFSVFLSGLGAGVAISCAALESWDGFSRTAQAKPDAGSADDPDATTAGSADGGRAIAPIQAAATATEGDAMIVTVELKAAEVEGNFILVAAGWYDDTHAIERVTDSSGNRYRLATTATGPGGKTKLSQSIYYASAIMANPVGNTITVKWNGPASYPDVRVAEYQGLDPNEPFDVASNGAFGNGTLATSPEITTRFHPALVVGAAILGGETGEYSAPGPGYTTRTKSDEGNLLEDRFVEESDTFSATAPLTVTSPWLIQVLAFH